MTLSLILPGLAAIALGVFAGQIRWSMKPAATLVLTTVLAAAGATTAFGILILTSAGALATTGPVSALVRWCPIIPLHHQVGPGVGLSATALSLAIVIRIRSVFAARRKAIAGTEGLGLSILETDEPIAYAAPGSPGCVVVSQGLLAVLSPRERRVLFAHERAHLRQRHASFLLVGALAVAVVPWLRPLVDQLRLATEQCADEAAAKEVGGDRDLVASAVVRAALATSNYRGLVGSFGGSSIPTRVEALIGSPIQPRLLRRTMALTGTVVVLSIASGGLQVHHFAQVAEHICS